MADEQQQEPPQQQDPPQQQEQPSSLIPAVTAVNIKIPPFWPADPEVWFAPVDAQFSTRNITSQKTIFDHVIASLMPEVAIEVRDIILKHPATNPYNSLKTQLIARTMASEQRRLQQLFNTEKLVDRKPSQLLRRMKQLLGDKAAMADTAFLRDLFLQGLPPNVRMVLASAGGSQSLEELADLADKVTDIAAQAVTQINTQLSSDVDQLCSEISDLKSLF